jgi:ribosomal protein S13
MDPGTAAIAVLSTITGVAGYGAMKLNSNQALAADTRANQLAAEKIEKVRRELTLATEDMKRKAEQELRAKQAEVDAFKRDLNSLKQSKAVLEGKLQEASEGERLFASAPLPAFKKAMGILKESPEI